jgi:hypothetical protein
VYPDVALTWSVSAGESFAESSKAIAPTVEVAMKPGQSIRFICHECLIALDVVVAPRDRWPDSQEYEADNDMDVNAISDATCPFCGSADITAQLEHARQNPCQTGPAGNRCRV